MQTLCRIVFVVLCSFLPPALLADGLIYQLPPDGSWVRYLSNGTLETSDGKVVTSGGSLTLSSVGAVVVDGEACRWIEFGMAMNQDDQTATIIHKMLIPEKHLGKGEDSLPHIRKVWYSHSGYENGKALEIGLRDEADRKHLKVLQGMMRGPLKNSQPLDKLVVESKLGKLECTGIIAHERTEPAPKVISDSTYLIRMHPSAPFGVITSESTVVMQRDGQEESTMRYKLKLVASGKDAKSKLPDSK